MRCTMTCGYAARLRDVLGVWVEEWLPLGPAELRTIPFARDRRRVVCTAWSEVVHVERAEVLVCNECGHVQLFRLDLTKKDNWWTR